MKCNANAERLRAYKIKLYPTESQKETLDKFINLYRYVFNWALFYEESNYSDDQKFIQALDMFSIFRDFRNSDGMEWLKELPLNTSRHAILDLIQSYKNFFENRSKHPKFKTRKRSKKSFTTRGDRLIVYEDSIRIEGFSRGETIICKNHNIPLDFNSVYYDCTVTFDGYDYWLALKIERPVIELQIPKTDPIGIDLGLRKLAVLSDGTEYKVPDVSKYEKRKRRQQKRVGKVYNEMINISKQTKTKFENIPKSKNMLKRERALRKTYNKMHDIRHTYIHTMTKEIVDKNPSTIVLETLDVQEMLQNKYLAQKVSEAMFYEIRRQIEYKASDRNIPVILADKNFPSSKMCSNCGNVKEHFGRSETYRCKVCGTVIDRDLNAAYNLRNLAY